MSDIDSKLKQALAILGNKQCYDGTSMGKQLGMTRAGVWKVIKKLTSQGINISSHKGKGYELLDTIELLDEKKIKAGLSPNIYLELFETIDSTSDHLLRMNHRSSGLRVCLAEHQSKARGRFARKWHAPLGQNVYFSLLYPFAKDLSALAGLSLVIGLSICNTINSLYELPELALVKWPNDIVYGDAKLGGILVEVEAEAHGFCAAVIGIGLNVNMVDACGEIDRKWTSIRKINNKDNDRNTLTVRLINDLLIYIRNFEQYGFEYFMEEWRSKDALLNKSIELKVGQNIHRGQVKGVNTQGHLLLQVVPGRVESFSSGEATLVR
jgi:BirA family biotin operon repressor/biotin-[acetyl-CoA-carboxylase] ligase